MDGFLVVCCRELKWKNKIVHWASGWRICVCVWECGWAVHVHVCWPVRRVWFVCDAGMRVFDGYVCMWESVEYTVYCVCCWRRIVVVGVTAIWWRIGESATYKFNCQPTTYLSILFVNKKRKNQIFAIFSVSTMIIYFLPNRNYTSCRIYSVNLNLFTCIFVFLVLLS